MSTRFKQAMAWRLGRWALGLIWAALAAAVWLSGSHDTRDALQDGRRLIITLDTGAIEGRQYLSEEAPAEATENLPEAAPAAAADAGGKEKEPAPPPVEAPAASESSPEATSEPDAPSPSAASEPPAAAVSKLPALPLAETNGALLEKSEFGKIPVIGPKDLRPWQHYAKPYAHKGSLPAIAVIITGLGQNKTVSESAVALPENFTLSFTPYAKDAAIWAQSARRNGHEILLDLPLEPSNYPVSDPGPYGLLAGKDPKENLHRLHWLMARAQGYIGFIAPRSEAFSLNDAAFGALMGELAARGLMIGLQHEPPRTETKNILDNGKSAYVIADAAIDEELSPAAIQSRLAFLEKAAAKRGFAIGVAQGLPLTIQQLRLWSEQAEKNGFVLVPVTFIAKTKFPPP